MRLGKAHDYYYSSDDNVIFLANKTATTTTTKGAESGKGTRRKKRKAMTTLSSQTLSNGNVIWIVLLSLLLSSSSSWQTVSSYVIHPNSNSNKGGGGEGKNLGGDAFIRGTSTSTVTTTTTFTATKTSSPSSPFYSSQVTMTPTTPTAAATAAAAEKVLDEKNPSLLVPLPSPTKTSKAKPMKLDYVSALNELLKDWKPPKQSTKKHLQNDDNGSDDDETALAVLFISPQWAPYLKEIASMAQDRIDSGQQQEKANDNMSSSSSSLSSTQVLTIVGGGVVGGGTEVQNTPSMSFMGGILPKGSKVQFFHEIDENKDNDDDRTIDSKNLRKEVMTFSELSKSIKDDINSKKNIQPSHHHQNQQHHGPSHFIFADPFCTKLHDVLEDLGADIVAGGISVGDKSLSSLAIGRHVLPPGSMIGTTFTGTVGLQVVVSHGCRPVGPTYCVTRVNGAAVHELNGVKAIEQLHETILKANDKDKELFEKLGILAGVHHTHQHENNNNNNNNRQSFYFNKNDQHDGDNNIQQNKLPEDFILREVNGFRPRSGSIMVCGQPQIQEGDYIRFHVRSSETALQDWESVLKRARTERIFLGKQQAGIPIGAFQISCMGRGQGLFQDERNVDLKHVQELLNNNNNNNKNNKNNNLLGQEQPQEQNDNDDNTAMLPIAGLFANAEIGPVRLRMGAPGGLPNTIATGSPHNTNSNGRSYLHGYSTVVAMLCDYSELEEESYTLQQIMPELSCLGNSTMDISAWE